jgi:hypothetical protein
MTTGPDADSSLVLDLLEAFPRSKVMFAAVADTRTMFYQS